MNIAIKATNLELTPAISDYVTEKMQSLEKLLGKDTDGALADVEIGRPSAHHRSGNVYRAEVNLSVGKVRLYVAAEKEDLYAAIDAMKDEILEAYRAHKDKKISNIKKGGSKIKRMLRGLWRDEA